MSTPVAYALGCMTGVCVLVAAQVVGFYVTEAHNRAHSPKPPSRRPPLGHLKGNTHE